MKLRSPLGWTVLTVALTAVLALSNAWWFYQALDHAATDMASSQIQAEACGSLRMALGMLPPLARQMPRSELLAVAQALAPSEEPFEKDGVTVVGALGFVFAPDGSLQRVTQLTEPPPCAR